MVLLELFVPCATYTSLAAGTYVWDYYRLLNGVPVLREGVVHEVKPVAHTSLAKYIGLVRHKKVWNAPVYINTGSGSSLGVGIPIGGGLDEEEEVIFQKVLAYDPEKDNNGCKITDFSRSLPAGAYKHNASFYINDEKAANVYFKKNRIDDSLFPAVLPMKVMEKTPVLDSYTASHYRIAGSSKIQVSKSYAKTLMHNKFHMVPEAIIMTALLGVCVVFTWEEQRERLARLRL